MLHFREGMKWLFDFQVYEPGHGKGPEQSQPCFAHSRKDIVKIAFVFCLNQISQVKIFFFNNFCWHEVGACA